MSARIICRNALTQPKKRKYRYEVAVSNSFMTVTESRSRARNAFKALALDGYAEKSLFNKAWRFMKKHKTLKTTSRQWHGLAVQIWRVEQ